MCVSRWRVLEGALVQLLPLGRRIQAPLAVAYIDELGLQAAGALPLTSDGFLVCQGVLSPEGGWASTDVACML